MAHLIFDRAMANGDEDRIREVAHHEILHVALALIRQSAQTIIEGMVPEAQRPMALDIYEQGEEATIEHLVRSLDQYINPTVFTAESDSTEPEDAENKPDPIVEL